MENISQQMLLMAHKSNTRSFRMTVLLLACFVSVGCFQSEIKCSDEASTAAVISLVKNTLAEQIEVEIKESKPSFDKSKISAFLNDTVTSLSDIRTTKKDPNSSKSFCTANFNAQFSNGTITDADATRKAIKFPSTLDFVRQNNLKFEANKLIGSLEYSVQPTDDRKKVYTEFEKGQVSLSVTAEIISSALMKSILDSQLAQQASQASLLVAVAKEKADLDAQNAKIEAELKAKAEAKALMVPAPAPAPAPAPVSAATPATASAQVAISPGLSSGFVVVAPEEANQLLTAMLKQATSGFKVSEIKGKIEALPKPLSGDRKAARKLNEQGLAALKSDDFAQALTILKSATATDPADVEVLNNYVFALIKAKRLQEAESEAGRLLTISPGRSSAWANLAEVYALKNKNEEAVAALILTFQFSSNKDRTITFLNEQAENTSSPLQVTAKKAIEIIKKM